MKHTEQNDRAVSPVIGVIGVASITRDFSGGTDGRYIQ